MTEPSPEPILSVSGNGGGGGGMGKATSSDSVFEDDASSLDKGILGPIEDRYIGGFPGGGAPVGFSVG